MTGVPGGTGRNGPAYGGSGDGGPPDDGLVYDLITMGRIGVDLYPLKTGVPLGEADTFGRFLGGSPANVAVAAARLGRRTALISRTGADPFGAYLRAELRGFGVDDRWVGEVDRYPTPITFCEIFPPDHFPLYFYRLPKAPDLEIEPDEVDHAAVRAARVFWMTGTGLSAEPSRSATLGALEARSKSGITVFDLDWRPMLWEGPPQPWYARALALATVAVGNAEECGVATGESEPYAAARRCSPPGWSWPSSNAARKGCWPCTATGGRWRCRRCR